LIAGRYSGARITTRSSAAKQESLSGVSDYRPVRKAFRKVISTMSLCRFGLFVGNQIIPPGSHRDAGEHPLQPATKPVRRPSYNRQSKPAAGPLQHLRRIRIETRIQTPPRLPPKRCRHATRIEHQQLSKVAAAMSRRLGRGGSTASLQAGSQSF
jgi:hypothetical protein